MLKSYPAPSGGEAAMEADHADTVWFDLFDPSPAESALVERTMGASLPDLGALREIETSSRLKQRDGILFMSTPSAAHQAPGDLSVAPVGFVLTAQRLVTVRFTPLPAFEAVAHRYESSEIPPAAGLTIFAELCEEIVGRVADGLEKLAEELTGLSKAAFHADGAKGRHAARSSRVLRIQLRQVGRLGDLLSEVRDGLRGLGRIIAFTDQNACEWGGGALKARLASLRQDIHALSDYEEQLANKVQFVLDAMVGLIGIAQNDVFKVLTIVSIVGIPPTLVAGIYGMNFKNMPEYSWAFGYQWGWMVIIVSALVPVAWFKIKGWF